MGDSLLILVLTYGHITSAMAFLGGALAFAFAVGPVLPRMQPAARRDLVVHLFPRFANIMIVYVALLAVFGALLVGALTNGDPSRLQLSDPWGLRVTIGGLLGALVVLDAVLFIAPSIKAMARVAEQLPPDGLTIPPREFRRLQGRVRASSMVSLVLMLAAIGFMVSAAGL